MTKRRSHDHDVDHFSLGSTIPLNISLHHQLHIPNKHTLLTNLTMASSRIAARSSRALFAAPRTTYRNFSISSTRTNQFEALNKRTNDTSDTYRKYQIDKPLTPHLTNTTSTIANEMPSVGRDNAPPELMTNVDPDHVPKDSVPENTERMTGGTQKQDKASSTNQKLAGKQTAAPSGTRKYSTQAQSASDEELGVGEMEGAKFKVEPIRRSGEDPNTMRARLLCPFLLLPWPHTSSSTLYTLISVRLNQSKVKLTQNRPIPQARHPRK